jgi:hypothetical protein
MAAKQAPSQAEKTPTHSRKNRPDTKAHQINRPATKAHKKNRETSAEETTAEETTTEKTT